MRNCIVTFFLLISLATFAQNIFEDQFVAKIYLHSSSQKLIFIQENRLELFGDRAVAGHIYYNPDGSINTHEQVTLISGDFFSYQATMTNGLYSTEIIRDGEKLIFRFRDGDNEKEKVRDMPPNLYFGPTLYSLIIQNWDKILEGDKIDFYMPVPEYLQIFKFTLFKKLDSSYISENSVVFTMDFSNRFLRLFFSNIDFVFELDSKRLIELHGKSILQYESEGDLYNPIIDAFFYYKQ